MADYISLNLDRKHWDLRFKELRKQALSIYSNIMIRAYQEALESNALPVVDSVNELPNVSGIYFIYDGDNLVYIGKSRNIKTRLSNHSRYFIGFRVGYWLFPADDIRRMEWTLIAILKPPYQKMYYLDDSFLRVYDISEMTGIDYHRKPTIPTAI